MRTKIAPVVVLCAAVTGGQWHAVSAPAPALTAASRAEETIEGAIAARINELRALYVPQTEKLLYDPEMVRMARDRAKAFADGAPFAHEDRPGHVPALESVQQTYGRAIRFGENLFVAQRGTGALNPAAVAKQAVDEWLASPGHRANIASPDFTATGIGVAVTRDRVYAAEIFRGPPARTRR